MSSETTVMSGQAAELQGLYGPFTFPEKLLQKIWLHGDFDRSRAVTLDGRRLQVLQPGRWNLMGGPDFKSARLRLGDSPDLVGDVELHLSASDWVAHHHAADPAYDEVLLHVVLFTPEAGHVTMGRRGAIPVLPLLPILLHDLEEYATEDAVETLAHRPAAKIMEQLGSVPLDELTALLRRQAEMRWRQKVHFARLRLQRLGWTEACHQTALEILGYRFNRAPMLRVAARLPLPGWTESACDVAAVYKEERGWSLQGLRPANHPRVRLQQYAAWVKERGDWPTALQQFADRLPAVESTMPAGTARRSHGLTALREEWASSVCGGVMGGSRFDTLACDGFLPLLAARNRAETFGLWRAWFPGDLPPILIAALRQLGAVGGRLEPASHGAAQGLLGWLLEKERIEADAGGREA